MSSLNCDKNCGICCAHRKNAPFECCEWNGDGSIVCTDPSKVVFDTTNGTNPSCESNYLFFCAYHTSGTFCDGKNSTDPIVCSAHGMCINDDECLCQPRYEGKFCQFYYPDQETQFVEILIAVIFLTFCCCFCICLITCSIICVSLLFFNCYGIAKNVAKKNIERELAEKTCGVINDGSYDRLTSWQEVERKKKNKWTCCHGKWFRCRKSVWLHQYQED